MGHTSCIIAADFLQHVCQTSAARLPSLGSIAAHFRQHCCTT